MNFINRAIDYMSDARGRAPKATPTTRNRVDADPQLARHHRTGEDGPKPPSQKIDTLPLRTWIVANPFSYIALAQSEAYYEEIDSIQAALVGVKSEFAAGHWYVVHPVPYWQVRDFNNEVLHDLQEWFEIECPNEFFTSNARQVNEFKEARKKNCGRDSQGTREAEKERRCWHSVRIHRRLGTH